MLIGSIHNGRLLHRPHFLIESDLVRLFVDYESIRIILFDAEKFQIIVTFLAVREEIDST